MQNNRTCISLLLLVIVFSCKREKFDESYDQLFDKWKWSHSITDDGTLNFNPSSIGHDYSIELTRKCILCKKDGDKVFKRKFKSISNGYFDNSSDTSSFSFFVKTSKNEDILITYIPNQDVLKVTGFPYAYITTNNFTSADKDYFYTNFYIRE